MKNKHYSFILALIFIVCILLISAVSAADEDSSDIISVDDNQELVLEENIQDVDDELILEENENAIVLDNTNENVLSDSNLGTFTDLYNYINGNDNDTIYLGKNYTFNPNVDSSYKNGVGIINAQTIYGNGFTLDGANAARIFSTRTSVIFHDIPFINGNASGENSDDKSGGAIYGPCTVVNCNFSNNYAEYNGGAITEATAINCNFLQNTAGSGGVIHKGKATACNFTQNTASEGGAMFLGTAINCNFAGNKANNRGGAIFEGNATDCNFTGNEAETAGGAIYLGGTYSDESDLKIDGCKFVNNHAITGGAVYYGTVKNCEFIKNTAEEVGGALSEGNASDCIFQEILQNLVLGSLKGML